MKDDQSHSTSTQETGTAPSLWNPSALANWSLLLTPLFGAYLLAENYKAMGKPKEAKKAMEWFYLGIAIFLSVILFSPFGLFGVALLIYLVYLVSWNFMAARKQQRAVLLAYGKSYERQPWGKVLVIGIAAIIAWQIIVRVSSSNVTSSLFPTTSFDSAEVKQVKSGVMQLCPSHTVDQMVKGFMGSPSWKSGKSADGKVFVNVEGDITFQDKPVRAMVQYVVEGESFSFSAFEMNGVPSANLIAIGLLNKMCARAGDSVPEKTAPLPQPDSAKSTAIEVQQPVPVDQASQSQAAFATEPQQSNAIEQIGICKGLNLSVTPDQIECAQREFENFDKQLNDTYKQLMTTLDPSRKAILKKEQIAWIKEKELKCDAQESEFEGGQWGRVLGMNCIVHMTEQRLAYLQKYK